MLTPVKAIRSYCITCGDGTAKEVRLCSHLACPLYPYRFGRRPTESEKEELKKALKDRE